MSNQVTDFKMGDKSWLDDLHRLAKRENRSKTLEKAIPLIDRIVGIKEQEIVLLKTMKRHLRNEQDSLR